MVDLSQFATVGGLGVLLGLVTQFLKRFVPPSQASLIPWIALALGVILAPIIGIALGDTTAQQLVSLAVTGLLAGLTSVGLYEATASNLPGVHVDQVSIHAPPPAVPPPT